MAKIIKTQQDKLAFLSEEKVTPSKQWLSLQKIKPSKSKIWFKAFPLSGGALFVQEGRFEILRDHTASDITAATEGEGSFNPARDSILSLIAE
jgi:hypothetical protein